MTQVVLNISRASFAGIGQLLSGSQSRISLKAPSREIVILGIILSILQISDGVLTAIGIGAFGTAAEGNSFLRLLMEQMGYIPALVTVKGFAIVVTCALCLFSDSITWIAHAMKLVIGVYLLAAIIPWTVILLSGVI